MAKIDPRLDPVFCLEDLDRYEPTATLTTTMTDRQKAPHTKLEASMRSTGYPNGQKGDGTWVKYHDVLRLMITVKEHRK